MGYRPTFRKQIGDPTTGYDSYICTMESGAMALDYHTQGAIKVWGGELLSKTGLTDPQIRDGTNLWDVDRAWAVYGQDLDIRAGQNWESFLYAIQSGRAAILQGDYDQFSLATRCQDSFTGNHAILVLPEKSGGNWLVGDPLCSDFKWVSEYELNRYATKLAISQTGSASKLYWGVTRAYQTEPQPQPQPQPTPVGVTKKYGGYEGYRGTWEVKESGSRFRTKPDHNGTSGFGIGSIIETVGAGYRFSNKQTTDKGSYTNGSKRWLGDATGDRWIHVSLVKLVS